MSTESMVGFHEAHTVCRFVLFANVVVELGFALSWLAIGNMSWLAIGNTTATKCDSSLFLCFFVSLFAQNDATTTTTKMSTTTTTTSTTTYLV